MASNVSTERVGALALFLTLFLYFASSKDGGDTSLSLSGADGRPFPGHVLVTGGAGFIGSHATMRLMDEGYAVTIVDNYSRGNPGAIAALRKMAPAGSSASSRATSASARTSSAHSSSTPSTSSSISPPSPTSASPWPTPTATTTTSPATP